MNNDKSEEEMLKEIHQMVESSDKIPREQKKAIEDIYDRVKQGEQLQPDDIRTLINALETVKEES